MQCIRLKSINYNFRVVLQLQQTTKLLEYALKNKQDVSVNKKWKFRCVSTKQVALQSYNYNKLQTTRRRAGGDNKCSYTIE